MVPDETVTACALRYVPASSSNCLTYFEKFVILPLVRISRNGSATSSSVGKSGLISGMVFMQEPRSNYVRILILLAWTLLSDLVLCGTISCVAVSALAATYEPRKSVESLGGSHDF